MTEFITFRHKSNGVIADYPAHYAKHPVLGEDLEVYKPEEEEYEEEKVVFDNHTLPVEQRSRKTATKVESDEVESNTDKDN